MAKYAQCRAEPSGKSRQQVVQRQARAAMEDNRAPTATGGNTGIPGPLKAGMEGVSGISLDHVRVHYNSDKPAQYDAHAYAQGADVHLGPGQEQHLPHELGHVVQQAQGRVSATRQMKGVALNDNPELESEATQLGKQALAPVSARHLADNRAPDATPGSGAVQRYAWQGENAVMQRSVVSDFTWSLLSTQFKTLGLNGLLTLADTGTLYLLTRLETFTQIVGKVSTFANALTIAINIWDAIPAPVKTGILFLTGKVATYLPNEKMVNSSHSLLVAADGDGAVGRLRTVLDYLHMILQAVKNPVTSAIQLGKFAYSWWWGGTKDEPSSENKKTVTPEERKKDLASIDLHIIWLKVGSVSLKNTQKKEKDKEEQTGGLHATFAMGYRLFDHEGSLGDDGKLTLILPWEGGAILESKGRVNLVEEIVFGSDLFVVRKLDMTLLNVSNDGLRDLTLELDEFSIAKRTIYADKIKADYHKGEGATFSTRAGIKLYSWEGGADLQLALDDKGKFREGTMKDFKENSKLVTIGESKISRSDGLTLTDARLNLLTLTGLDIQAIIEKLHVKDNAVTGIAKVTGNNIPLWDEKVKLDTIEGKLTAATNHWEAEASAKLSVIFTDVQASGKASIRYNSEEKKTHIVLSEGKFSADYKGLHFDANGLGYNHDDKRFTMETANLTVKIQDKVVAGTVQDVTIDKNGVKFNTALVKGPRELTLFKGFTLEELQLLIRENGKSMTLSSNAKLGIGSVEGEAKQIRIGVEAGGFEGSIASASVKTPIFNLGFTDAKIDKEGLTVKTAQFRLGDDRSRDKEKEMKSYVPDLNLGWLDFLPVGFEVGDISINKDGLSVKSFTPTLDKISFAAFGAFAELDPKNQSGKAGYKNRIELKDLVAGLPLQVSMIFPVFPGLEVYGLLEAGAGLDIDIALSAKGNDGIWAVGDHANFIGSIFVKVELGANAGSQMLVALSAGLFAKGEAKLDAGAKLSGETHFDRKNRKFIADKPLVIDYRFKPEAIASIGVVVKAKALYFFEKTLFEYTAAEWRMGAYALVGTIGDKENALVPDKPKELGIKGPKTAMPDHREIKGEEAQTLLKSDRWIEDSGDERMAILTKERGLVTKQLAGMKAQSIKAAKERLKLEENYIRLMNKKVTYFHSLFDTLDDTEANKRLVDFNKKYGIETLQEQYAVLVEKEETLTRDIEKHLSKLASLANVNRDALETGGLAAPLSTVDESQKAANGLELPDTQSFGQSLALASEGLDAAIQRDNVVISGINRVMSAADFERHSTTRELFGTTSRKKIKSVDNALETFHKDKSKANLKALAQAIKTYLNTNPGSGRGPVVKVLQEQVRIALEAFG